MKKPASAETNRQPAPEATSGQACIAGLFVSFFFYSVVYLTGNLRWLSEPIELARHGRATEATIDSCKTVRSIGAKGVVHYDRICEVRYADHCAGANTSEPCVGRIDAFALRPQYTAEAGGRFPAMYLPYKPSVVWVGGPEDTAWTLIIKNVGWFVALFNVGYISLPVIVTIWLVISDLLHESGGKTTSSSHASPSRPV